jgi:enterochelin esterase-like enzyme
VIPYIQSHYRTASDRDARAIAGLSMGGGQALSIGLNHLDLFSHVAGFSSGFGPAPEFRKTFASLIAHLTPPTRNCDCSGSVAEKKTARLPRRRISQSF